MMTSPRTLAIGALLVAGLLAVLFLVTPLMMSNGDPDPVPPITNGDPDPVPPITNGDPGPEPPTSIGVVDRSVRELDWGSIAFNVSTSMSYQRPHPVEVLLSPTLTVTELQEELQEKVDAEAAQVRISNRMEAHLTGRGYAIEALTPSLQAVASDQITRWRWRVTPTTHGHQSLHLTLSAYIDVAGRDAPLVVRTFDREIDVDITIRQRASSFLGKYWQWLFTVILLPIAGYIWKLGRSRRTMPPRQAGDQA